MVVEPPKKKECHKLKEIPGLNKAAVICGVDEPPVRIEEEPGLALVFKSILNQVKNHHASWPFVKPVDKNEVPDYYDYIPYPMGKLYFCLTLLKHG